MKEYKISEINEIHIYGRTGSIKQPLPLFWSASGIEMNVQASEMWLEVESDYETMEPWIAVLLDSAMISRQMVQKGRYWIPLFRGLDKETKRKVRVVREVQAMSDDADCCLKLHAIRIDGEFCPIDEKKMKIEIIGDSNTCGEGIVGAKGEMCWSSMVFGASSNYATMVAEALKADYRIVSQSGWGVLCSWDGDPARNIPAYYEKVCGLTVKGENAKCGAGEDYNFASWKPDYVFINLGTNDASAFSQPSVYNDVNGVLFDQRIEEDGSFEKASLQRFKYAVADFIKKVRKCNPDAYIIWGYGMLGLALRDAIVEVINSYKKESGDDRIEFMELTPSNEETVGSREHPGILCHKQAAKKIIERLNRLSSPHL